MTKISITELRKNLNHYIELSSKEDIFITKHNKVVAVLSNPDASFYKTLFELYGSVPDSGEDYEKVIGQAIIDKCA